MPVLPRFQKRYVSVAIAVLVFCAAIWAQTESATISGSVTDQSGALLAGANVNLTNILTGVSISTISNDVGLYVFNSVRPGRYRIIVEKAGFRQIVLTELTVNVQDSLSRNFSMKIGVVGESVTLTAEATRVRTEPSVSTVVDREFVNALPLNGRSFESLILITPGVTFTTPNGNDTGQFSVNGQRASTNYMSVDGVSANLGMSFISQSYLTEALAGAYQGLNTLGGTNNLAPMGALEEYKIQTSTYTAELGHQPGGQVSLATRSGTNAFHGGIFEYLRNDVLDARNFFNKVPDPKPPLRQNIFGGSISGPIYKDRTFFFFSYEGIRLRLPQNGNAQVPSLRVRNAAAPSVKPILNAFPLPTGPETYWDDDYDSSTPDVLSGWAPLYYSVSNPSRADTYSLRVDHTFGRELLLFGRYGEAPSESTSFNYNLGPSGNGTVASTRTLTLGAGSAFTPDLNNDFRINWSRQLAQFRYVQATFGGAVPVDPALLTNGLPGRGSVAFLYGSGFSEILGGEQTRSYQRQLNIVDSVSLNKKKHLMRFGIDYRRLSPTYGPQDRQDVFFYTEEGINTAITDDDSVTSFQSANLRYSNWSLYGQDTWRVSRRLTLDLGLRWELNPAPIEADGKMPPIVLGITNPPDVSNATLAPQSTSFYKTFYGAFAPRFGAAYALQQGAGHQTVLRGGFGVYYDLGSGTAAGGYPVIAKAHYFSGVPYPLSAEDAARPTVVPQTTTPIRGSAFSTAQNLRLPYTLQWNVAVEQQLGTQQSLSLSYVGSAGRRLLTQQQLNAQASQFSGPRPNPNFAYIFFTSNGPTSDYNSFQAQYRASLRRELQALVNYTWSHAIDEVSSDLESGTLLRGNASFDVRHNLSAALTYNPSVPWTNTFTRQLLSNWSVDSIVHSQTGQPVDVFLTTATVIGGQLLLLRPNVVPGQPFYIDDPSVPGGRRFNSAAFTTPPPDPANPNVRMMGNFGRNVLRGNGVNQVDFALGRAFQLHEAMTLLFKAELFNVFNHPMFGNYGWYTDNPSTFGVPRSTLNVNLYTVNAQSPLYALGCPRSVQFSLRIRF